MHAETELVYPKFEIARVNAQKGAEGLVQSVSQLEHICPA